MNHGLVDNRAYVTTVTFWLSVSCLLRNSRYCHRHRFQTCHLRLTHTWKRLWKLLKRCAQIRSSKMLLTSSLGRSMQNLANTPEPRFHIKYICHTCIFVFCFGAYICLVRHTISAILLGRISHESDFNWCCYCCCRGCCCCGCGCGFGCVCGSGCVCVQHSSILFMLQWFIK